MKTIIITAVWAAFLFGLYSLSHGAAIIVGVIGIVLVIKSGDRPGPLTRA